VSLSPEAWSKRRATPLTRRKTTARAHSRGLLANLPEIAPKARLLRRSPPALGANDNVYRIMAALMRTLMVRVKPGSREDAISQLADGSWEARVKAPPVDGKANAALVALVASHFGLRKAQVSIRSGAGSRLKRVQLEE